MDRFPQYPPHLERDRSPVSSAEILWFFAVVAGGITVWILALLALGYWIAGAAPIGGAYIHGVLLGMLLGIVLVLTVITPRKETPQ